MRRHPYNLLSLILAISLALTALSGPAAAPVRADDTLPSEPAPTAPASEAPPTAPAPAETSATPLPEDTAAPEAPTPANTPLPAVTETPTAEISATAWPEATTATPEAAATETAAPPTAPATQESTATPTEAAPSATAAPSDTAAPEAPASETPAPPTPTTTLSTVEPSATPTPSAIPPSETATPTPTPTVSPTAANAAPVFSLGAAPVLAAPADAPCASITLPPAASVMVSQVYGGGGNTGAPYLNDFIELYNVSAAPVMLTGWSVQYASAAGSTWQAAPLAGVLAAGDFWLIQLGSGGSAGQPLPAPDQSAALNLAATAGKIALVNGTAALSGVCPAAPNLVDFLGYGAASCAEGRAVTGLGNSLAAVRAGLVDTNDNAADFSAAPPNPRHSASAPPLSATPSPAFSATPSPAFSATPSPAFSATPSPSPPATPSPTTTPSPAPSARPAFPGAVLINEIVTDPQQDWSGAGFSAPPGAGPVGDTDEFVELLIRADGLDLTGWQIALLDGSDVRGDLTEAGAFQAVRYAGGGALHNTRAGDRLVLGNVRGSGSMTNAVQIVLSDAAGNVIDAVTLGGDAPNGNAAGLADEAVARRPDGQGSWIKQPATPGENNEAAPLPAPSATPTATPAATGTPSPTATFIFTPSPTASPYPPGSVLINEVAWAGTAASSADEWLELYNPGGQAIPLAGWTLSDAGDLHISFPANGMIPAGGYWLLERTDDTAVADIPADLIYSGGLSNSGETLTLRDGSGAVIDVAAGAGGWPAGDAETRASMERAPDGGWRTHAGAADGRDAQGAPIAGTPRGPNSALRPPPTPMPFTHAVLINEFLPSPGAGGQEFIELINTDTAPADLGGWQVDDQAGGSAPYTLPAGTVLAPGQVLVFFKETTGLALNNGGDRVRLLAPDGQVADEWAYARAARTDVSWARVPDGGAWMEQGAPSPGALNGPYVPPPAAPARTKPETETPAVALGVLRTWPVGAWAVITGRVTAPAGLFEARVVYVQDETGALPVYLGRGEWPALVPGQSLTALGYTRLRSGALEFYVRNFSLVGVTAVEGQAITAAPAVTATLANAGQLVTLTGRVVRLESSAFWLDAGAGPVRVFFASGTEAPRPKAARGEVWTVTGVVTEMAATKTRAAGYQLQPRFREDVAPGTAAPPAEAAP